MKNIKFLSLLLGVVGVLSFASCEHKHADFEAGAQDSSMGLYFPSTARVDLTEDGSVAQIVVKRNNSDEAASVSARVLDVDNCGLFTIQGTEFEDGTADIRIDFAADSDESVIEFGYNGAELEIGKRYNFTIKLEEKNASIYGISEATFSLTIPEPWVAWDAEGTQGIYFDDCLRFVFAEPDPFAGLGTYVDFEKHELNPNRIRVVDPFSKNNIAFMWGGVPSWMTIESGDDPFAIEFDITNPKDVKIKSNPILLNLIVSGTRLAFYVHENEEGGFLEPIVLENGIIKFPKDKVGLLAIDPSTGDILGAYQEYANPNGEMMFYLPGTEFVNYAIEATYDGMFISPDGSIAKAIFNFALGTDVDSYKFAFAEGDVTDDPSATVEAIATGSDDLTIFESDRETTRWEVELSTGNYTIVVVPFTAKGEARVEDAFAKDFYFNGAGEMPEVDVQVEIGAPSELVAPEEAAAKEQQRPACFNIGVKITTDASLIKAISTFNIYPDEIEEQTADQLFDEYGVDATDVWKPILAEAGSVVGNLNVVANSTNVVYVRFETIYGTTIDYISEPYTVPEYDGDVKEETYVFVQGDDENAPKVQFSVIPYNSYEDFMFKHSIDATMWYAKYDKAAGTLSTTGVMYGFEQYENMYGDYMGTFDQEKGLIYGYFSSSTADFAKANEPFVMTVTDGLLSGINSYFTMRVGQLNPDDSITYVSDYFAYTPENISISVDVPEAPETPETSSVMFASKSCKLPVVSNNVSVVGAGVKSKPVIKATPVYTFDFAQATLK